LCKLLFKRPVRFASLPAAPRQQRRGGATGAARDRALRLCLKEEPLRFAARRSGTGQRGRSFNQETGAFAAIPALSEVGTARSPLGTVGMGAGTIGREDVTAGIAFGTIGTALATAGRRGETDRRALGNVLSPFGTVGVAPGTIGREPGTADSRGGTGGIALGPIVITLGTTGIGSAAAAPGEETAGLTLERVVPTPIQSVPNPQRTVPSSTRAGIERVRTGIMAVSAVSASILIVRRRESPRPARDSLRIPSIQACRR